MRISVDVEGLLMVIDQRVDRVLLYRPPGKIVECTIGELVQACDRVLEQRKDGANATDTKEP